MHLSSRNVEVGNMALSSVSQVEQPEHQVWGELPPKRRFSDERWTRKENQSQQQVAENGGNGEVGGDGS